MIFSPKNLFLLFTNEARRAEKEPRRGDLSPEGAGDAAQRLVNSNVENTPNL